MQWMPARRDRARAWGAERFGAARLEIAREIENIGGLVVVEVRARGDITLPRLWLQAQGSRESFLSQLSTAPASRI
jgi:hypothetical protein